jgi:glucose-1-phosphate adenylyltransferase
MALLDKTTRQDLFSAESPVYTKVRNDMPVVYGINSCCKNSLVADGCQIEGTVKNSVLFRGVKVQKGAVVENSIIMQDVVVDENAHLEYVTVDKKVQVGVGKTLIGSEIYPIYVRKNAKV